MHTEQLAYFMMVRDTGSFSAAAKQVPMSPQGLTKSIRALEAELGVSLFETDKSGSLALTAYGEALEAFARSYRRERDVLAEEIQRIKASERFEIRLGSSLGVMGLLGTDFITRFHYLHPHIHLVVHEDVDALCDANLKQGAYDFAFTLAPFDRDFETELLFETRVCFWVPDDDPLFERATISLEDLAGKTVAIPGEDFKCYDAIIKACADRGAEPAAVVTSSEIFWIYEFALHGEGLGFSIEPHASLPMFQTSDQVRCIPVDDRMWRFGISHLSGRSLKPYEQEFLSYVKTCSTRLMAKEHTA